VWHSDTEAKSFKLFNNEKGEFAEGAGGIGDSDVAVDASGRVYVLGAGSGLRLYTSADGGSTWRSNPDISAGTQKDRQWAAAGGPGHAVASWVGGNVSVASGVFFAQSKDGGASWSAPAAIARDQDIAGPIVMADDRTLALAYVNGFDDGPVSRAGGEIHVLLTRDAGATWNDTKLDHKLPQGPGLLPGLFGDTTPSFFFPTMAADSAGNLYVAWSEYRADGSTAIWWSRSLDHGTSWLPPTQLTSTANAVFPALAAGSPGRVALAYLATDSGGDPNHATGSWSVHVMTGVGADRTDGTGLADVVSASNVHTGSICPNANNCNGAADSTGDRTLLDFIKAVVTPSGRVAVSYTTDPIDGAKRPHVAVVIQESGTLLR
jgi:hypothetical protein